MLKYQDIRISDVTKRDEFIADVEAGNYATAHAIVTPLGTLRQPLQ